MFRFGVTNKRMDINALFNNVDLTLFKKCCKLEHCLRHLLPPIKINSINTRKRGHSYTLPICKRDIYRNSFIPRCLFNIVWQFHCMFYLYMYCMPFIVDVTGSVCLLNKSLLTYLLTYFKITVNFHYTCNSDLHLYSP